MRNDLKASALIAAAVALPLFFIFGALWNPHRSSSLALYFVGLFGIAPFLYVAEYFGYQHRLAAVVFASLAQYFWFFLWVFMLRRIWYALPWRKNAP
jgi:hypothetical protein